MRAYRKRRGVTSGATPSIAAPGGGGTEPLIVHAPASYPIPVAPIDPAQAIREWAATLVIPDGLLSGKHFDVADWEVAFLRDALAPGCRDAALSVSRKNGKSALVALLLLSYLVGPLHFPGWRGLVTSLTGQHSKELRHQIEAIAGANGLPVEIRRSPTPGECLGPNRTRLSFLPADAGTGHSLGADLAVVDELGLMGEAQRDLWNAIRSSVSGRDGRVVAISIQGGGPFMPEIAERASDPSTVWHHYAAPFDCKLDDPVAWAAANPGLAGGIKSTSYMADRARAALLSPADQSSFRAHDLNQPQSPTRETIVSVTDWDACETEQPPERDGVCVVGFDAGGSVSMTACAAIWPATGRVEVWAALPGTPDLLTRGQADGVGRLYQRMHDAGELVTYAGRVTPVVEFIQAMADRLAGQRVIACGADRFRKAEVLEGFERAGVAWPLVWRGQGASSTADGSHDVRAFQRAGLRGWLQCAPSLLMMHAIAESSVTRDASGNPKLDKARFAGRIDALQAAVIATGLAEIHNARRPATYRSLVLS